MRRDPALKFIYCGFGQHLPGLYFESLADQGLWILIRSIDNLLEFLQVLLHLHGEALAKFSERWGYSIASSPENRALMANKRARRFCKSWCSCTIFRGASLNLCWSSRSFFETSNMVSTIVIRLEVRPVKASTAVIGSIDLQVGWDNKTVCFAYA